MPRMKAIQAAFRQDLAAFLFHIDKHPAAISSGITKKSGSNTPRSKGKTPGRNQSVQVPVAWEKTTVGTAATPEKRLFVMVSAFTVSGMPNRLTLLLQSQ